MFRMLIVESESVFANAWRELFHRQRLWVEVVDNCRHAREHLRERHYDVIILQTISTDMQGPRPFGLENRVATGPDIDGIELCRSYRDAGGSSPILLTSARHSTEEMEKGLEAGADDYMAQPIKLRELTARVRALLRRPASLCRSILQVRDILLDTDKGILFVGDKELHLHPMELNLLEFLMRHQDQVFSAQTLLDRVWCERSRASLGSVRTHIKTLRHKLGDIGHSSIIVTVVGRGYKIVP